MSGLAIVATCDLSGPPCDAMAERWICRGWAAPLSGRSSGVNEC